MWIKLVSDLVQFQTSTFATFDPRAVLQKKHLTDQFGTSGDDLYFRDARFRLRLKQTREAVGFLYLDGTVGLH